MSETKTGGKTVGSSEKCSLYSENFAIIAKFRYDSENFT